MYPKSFKKLIDHFASLPSIGPKMAERLVLFLFRMEEEKIFDFARSLENLKKNIRHCRKCFNLSEGEVCHICQDPSRNKSSVCVVEDPLDVIAIERIKKYNGLYHVLGGVLESSAYPKEKEIRLPELEKRLREEKFEEIILATNPTTEGDATALYIKRLLSPSGVKITRLARGLSTGADLEHADEITLGEALSNRK